MACNNSVTFFFLIIVFVLFPLFVLSQNDDGSNAGIVQAGIVQVGSKLTAGETSTPWLSPSEEFAFGFKKIQDQDLFLVCVWYNKIPDQTVAWFLNTVYPVPRGSTLELNAQEGLLLRDPRGASVWKSEGIADEVRQGFMNDTGNFVLKRTDFGGIWETFAHVSDTILPLQELVSGNELISRKSETNFSRGRFYLQFLNNGNLVLNTKSLPTNSEADAEYYSSQTSDTSADGPQSGVRVIFEQRGSIYIRRRNNQTKVLTPLSLPPAAQNYYRATLNFDGVFTHYYHPRNFTGNPGWTPLLNLPNNICTSITGGTGSGACGYNSVCRINNGRPDCECPEGYELIDPNDKYGSCKPKFTLTCGGGRDGQNVYDLLEIPDIDWPLSDYQMFTDFTEERCKQVCLEDCLCAVAIFRSNTCWKKKLPLSNGRVEVNSKALMKYNKSSIANPQNPGLPETGRTRSKENGVLITVGSALLGTSVFVNVLLISAACFGFFFKCGKKTRVPFQGNDSVESNLRVFTYKELEEATNVFKEEVGRGSFGIVYKGVLIIGSTCLVAVKKIDRVARDVEKEFRAEVNAIGRTHHKNLVRLLGFCDEGEHRLLVYEYVTNGTLSNFLFSKPKPSWNLRNQIAVGIARGLTYLHEECTNQIIHCDIKPQNILLDEYYNVRISDFGLAKLLVLNQSKTLTDIRGTKGYVAPEWFRNTQVNAKVDVYSFGVVLLEIICCRRCLEDVETGGDGGENPILVEWVWDCYQEGRLDTLVGNDLEASNDKEKLERFVKAGIWCIQEDSSLRPTMRKVSQMLEGIVEVLKPPCPYLFPFCS